MVPRYGGVVTVSFAFPRVLTFLETKFYSAENISLQRFNSIIFGLTDVWPYSLPKPDFSDLG